MSHQSERELVDAAISGSRDAFAALVERYQRVAVASAVAVLGDLHAAQDAAQEAFVIAYQKLPTLRDPESFGVWISRIARRQASRAARRRNEHQSINENGAATKASTNGHLDDDAQQLLKLVDKLPEHERVVVVLKYFDGRSVEEIATSTQQTIGTVTKKLTRARQRLRSWLERYDQ